MSWGGQAPAFTLWGNNTAAQANPFFLTTAQAQTMLGIARAVPATGNTAVDTAAVNAALALGPGAVLLSSAAYTLGAITVPGGVTLQGGGPNGTVITASGNPSSLFTCSGDYAQIQQLGIRGSCNVGITISSRQECRVNRVNIEGSGSTINNGIMVTGSGGYFNRIENSRIDACGTGVSLGGSGALETVLNNLNIGLGTTGVLASNCNYFAMNHVELLGCSGDGFSFTSCGFDATNCLSDSCGGKGWAVTNIASNSVDCGLVNCWGGSCSNGFYFVNSSARFTGCQAGNNSAYGFLGVGTGGLANNYQYVVTGCEAWGNNTSNSGAHGMYFNNCLVNATGNFAGGRSGSTLQLYGIFCDTGALGVLSSTSGAGNVTGTTHIAGSMTNGVNMP